MSNQVQVELRVGLLDVSLAQLITKDHQLIEFPTLLLPSDVKAGSIVRLTCERDVAGEQADEKAFESTQDAMLQTFTADTPKKPVLKVKNTTQTSVVLEWDPVDVASADLHSLALYKNGQRLGTIPNPASRTSTKLSNLAIDTEYTFHLMLSTSAGVFESEPVTVHTHKMTDLSGITICVGDLNGSEISREELEQSIDKMGCKPLQDSVKLDTTHFVAANESGRQCQRAKDLSIPVVRPEWVYACETERRLVGVRSYYLSADPKSVPPSVRRSRTATVTSTQPPSQADVTVPKVTVSPPEETADTQPTDGQNAAEANGAARESQSDVAEDAPSGNESAEAVPPVVDTKPDDKQESEPSAPAESQSQPEQTPAEAEPESVPTEGLRSVPEKESEPQQEPEQEPEQVPEPKQDPKQDSEPESEPQQPEKDQELEPKVEEEPTLPKDSTPEPEKDEPVAKEDSLQDVPLEAKPEDTLDDVPLESNQTESEVKTTDATVQEPMDEIEETPASPKANANASPKATPKSKKKKKNRK